MAVVPSIVFRKFVLTATNLSCLSCNSVSDSDALGLHPPRGLHTCCLSFIEKAKHKIKNGNKENNNCINKNRTI